MPVIFRGVHKFIVHRIIISYKNVVKKLKSARSKWTDFLVTSFELLRFIIRT